MTEYASDAVLLDGERVQLDAFLADYRVEIARGLDGLTDEQARRRLVPSLTSPLSIVKHCAFVERVWFQVVIAERTRAEIGIPESAEDSWTIDESDTVASVLADHAAACAESVAIAAQHGLDDVTTWNRRGPLTVRWIYLHMLEELARHAGHADILREQILAADAE
jgi:hypothetical protein